MATAKLFLVVLTILAVYSSVTNGIGWKKEETLVVVLNNLPPNTMLTYHCKSKDDDLGERSLPPDNTWSWRFSVNIWDTTLYWCNFWWNENGKPRQESYQIYKAKRDMGRCGYYCRNAIRSDGVYGFNGAMEPYLIHKWP
ncbi:hypothetical protein MKW94_019633 [Papaver nudicaule]|uniref:S-protein homolog n=1 Tax=Papaver nudicaule TaxID=74823 RepID=A0AA41W107_PAPNU|nr:hypothetical protein [Papaver nudicaule]